ncbi:restriction endonuclease subunit S [Thiorhodospira sibirica]|uniref:restriction endonuclease subunit S n=1 Tax=Thiorhodospira sibirica TaxID=154347 RepID=UPI00022C1D2C|nr:restriction endonuclease subunit S [Thiorhodospira sibirica]
MSEKKGLVPRLRFPEFREAGEWEEKPLEGIGEFTGGGTPSRSNDSFWKGNIPWVSSSDISEDSIHEIKISRFITPEALKNSATKLVPKNSILLVSRVGVGKLAITKSSVCTSQDFTNLTPWNDNLEFLGYLLASNRSVLESFGQGMAIKGFTKEDISKLAVYLPNLKEQRKIAACLSSLDALITAQADKLDALKTHKKGLMQQLFPREGETVPRLRFPEFREAGEWEETTLGQHLSRQPEYGINAPAVAYHEKLPVYLRITDISDDGQIRQDQKVSVAKNVTDQNYLEEGDIVLARTGASVGKAYKYRKKDGRLVFAGFLIRIRPDENKLDSELLYQFLSTEKYWRWVAFISARSGQPGINGKEYASLPFQIPPTLDEQQKIAACLSSLDTLITAQADKLDALKLHKKGLMQQLFPVASATEEEPTP